MIRAGLLLALVGFAGLLTASPAAAAPKVTEKFTYYALSGRTTRELNDRIRAAGPADGGAKHWGAMTYWSVRWTYQYSRGRKGCPIVDVAVAVDITYIYPRWINENQGTLRARELWHSYLFNLETHERGHGQHGIDAGREIERILTGMPVAPDCDIAGTNANARGEEIVRKYTAADVEYDRVTGNGRTQGAYLPN